jgi:hypothetical protein
MLVKLRLTLFIISFVVLFAFESSASVKDSLLISKQRIEQPIKVIKNDYNLVSIRENEPVKKLSAIRTKASFFRSMSYGNHRLNFNDDYSSGMLGLEFNESKNLYSLGFIFYSDLNYDVAGGAIGYTRMFTRNNYINLGVNTELGISRMQYLPELSAFSWENATILNAAVGLEVQVLFISFDYKVGIGMGGNDLHKQRVLQQGIGVGYFIIRGKDEPKKLIELTL